MFGRVLSMPLLENFQRIFYIGNSGNFTKTCFTEVVFSEAANSGIL